MAQFGKRRENRRRFTKRQQSGDVREIDLAPDDMLFNDLPAFDVPKNNAGDADRSTIIKRQINTGDVIAGPYERLNAHAIGQLALNLNGALRRNTPRMRRLGNVHCKDLSVRAEGIADTINQI